MDIPTIPKPESSQYHSFSVRNQNPSFTQIVVENKVSKKKWWGGGRWREGRRGVLFTFSGLRFPNAPPASGRSSDSFGGKKKYNNLVSEKYKEAE